MARDWTHDHYDRENDLHAASRCASCGHFKAQHDDAGCHAGDHTIPCTCGQEDAA